jgi:uncharacterized protein (TIGR00251 family)
MSTSRADAATLRVRVQPRASRHAIVGWAADVLRVAVTAPPVDGAANDALRRLLAAALGVAPSAINIVRGERGRDKIVRIVGITDVDVRARLSRGGARREGRR